MRLGIMRSKGKKTTARKLAFLKESSMQGITVATIRRTERLARK
jgi:hypothetical protein